MLKSLSNKEINGLQLKKLDLKDSNERLTRENESFANGSQEAVGNRHDFTLPIPLVKKYASVGACLGVFELLLLLHDILGLFSPR